MIALRLLPVVLKQVIRHRTRSGLTVAGVAVAMFLYCGVEAMQSGARRATQARASDSTLIVYRKDRYCPAASRMPESYIQRIQQTAGVASAIPMKIVVTNCRASLDVVTFRGVPEDAFDGILGSHVRIVQGSVGEWKRRTDAVLIGEALARRRGATVGGTLGAAGITAYVAGIIHSDEPQHENVAYAHLPFLQVASGSAQGGVVTQFNVTVRDPKQLAAVAEAIDDEFRADQEPTSTRAEREFVARAAADVLEIVGFTRWLGFGCLAAVLGLVANAIVLAVQDRMREHAVLQTLGYRGGLIARMIVAEGLVLSTIGGFVGVVGAMALLRWLKLSLSVEGVSISAAVDWSVFAIGLGVSVIVGVLASVVPAWQAGRREIAECFRAV